MLCQAIWTYKILSGLAEQMRRPGFRFQPRQPGRQLEQQRQELPVSESQQEHPVEHEQQPWLPPREHTSGRSVPSA
jgi:hypothetical protein